MAPKFTSINAGASTCGAAAARARVQSQGPAVTGPIQRAVKTQRKPAKGANPEIMRKHIEDLKLELEREGENFRWPLGLTAGNVVVAKIKKPADVPDALSLQTSKRDAATSDFVYCAKQNSRWSHGKIAACIGRSEQASRLIMHHAKIELAARAAARAGDGQTVDQHAGQALERRTAQAAEEHAAQEAAAQEAAVQEAAQQATAQESAQDAVPAPTLSSSVGQLDRPELLHSPTQTSLEAQFAAAQGQLSGHCVHGCSGSSLHSDQVRSETALWRPGSDSDTASSKDDQNMSPMHVLAAASAMRARNPERQLPPLDAGRKAPYVPALVVMETI
ncbi:hypothetical protein M436DRAFT_64117 [Aureobasidium namibiae CBS 147.97]|uniref:Uncharacterized protein n=1 Tax=Aureobasidium namibiae CBS 147.97 TaxID=1043004 RepID=A0A074XEA8_9PEZI|nr:uncharacterized protein M436DRAFT_64117 [Aureobasidium namibiae CBS 147.97]KEQ72951.1 hypothetical protein M436DRAFT_64117 [Aureobasidium namibiae CBS 147.97]